MECKEAQLQRSAEQALRNRQIEEAKKAYTTFNELPLEIVVDVRSFTISVLPKPEEIVIPGFPTTEKHESIVSPATSRRPAVKSYRDPNKASKVGMAGKGTPVSVASEPSKSTKLKTPSSRKNRAKNRVSVKTKSRTVKPRQSGLFKRFIMLVIRLFKGKFVWAKRKPDTTDAYHDKRIAENYIFDEVLGVKVPRSEFEKRAKFNNDQKSPEAEFCGNVSDNDKTVRFPNHPRQTQPKIDKNTDPTPSIPSDGIKNSTILESKPSWIHDKKIKIIHI